MSRKTELAWAAGFFDGEGCFTLVSRAQGRKALSMSITQVDSRPLQRFADLFNLNVGGPRTRVDGLGKKPWYVIHVTGLKAEYIAQELMRFLSAPKQEQLAVCLDKVNQGMR